MDWLLGIVLTVAGLSTAYAIWVFGFGTRNR
jgi:hypothetical protein